MTNEVQKHDTLDELKRLQALGRGISPSLRIDQVQQLLAVSRSTVYRLIAEREIVAFKVRDSLRITFESLLTYQQKKISEFLEEEYLL